MRTTIHMQLTEDECAAIKALNEIRQEKLAKICGTLRSSMAGVLRDLLYREAMVCGVWPADAPQLEIALVESVPAKAATCDKRKWAGLTRQSVMHHEAAIRERFGKDSDAAIELAVQNTRGWLKKRVVGDTREFQAIPVELETEMEELLPKIASAAVAYAVSRSKIPTSYFDKARAWKAGGGKQQ